jgi:cytoskeletal protein CcmA (bactofilin family)
VSAPAAPPTAGAPRPVPAAPAPGPRAPRDVVRDAGAVRRESVAVGQWIVSGSAKVTGNVTAAVVESRGLLSVGGSLRTGTLVADGTLEVLGPTEVSGTARFDGTYRPTGPAHLGVAEVRGVLRTPTDLKVDRELRVAGSLEAPSVHVGYLEIEGSANVPGVVASSTKIRAQFKSDSTLGSLTAPEVVLRGPPPGLVPNLMRKVFGGAAHIEVERIEAERVELEAVEVAFVRAAQVVLGPGAHVTALEGTIVRQHATARVGPESHTPPPHGLSR